MQRLAGTALAGDPYDRSSRRQRHTLERGRYFETITVDNLVNLVARVGRTTRIAVGRTMRHGNDSETVTGSDR